MLTKLIFLIPGTEHYPSIITLFLKTHLLPVVQQFYEAQVYDEYVIKGNSAIFKCQIPSFVADHVEINFWTATSGEYYFPNSTGTLPLYFRSKVLLKPRLPSKHPLEPYLECNLFYLYPTVVPQKYSVNVMDEAVLKGNSGILKCHIPSFVADFIQVLSWVDDENREIYSNYDGVAKITGKT